MKPKRKLRKWVKYTLLVLLLIGLYSLLGNNNYINIILFLIMGALIIIEALKER